MCTVGGAPVFPTVHALYVWLSVPSGLSLLLPHLVASAVYMYSRQCPVDQCLTNRLCPLYAQLTVSQCTQYVFPPCLSVWFSVPSVPSVPSVCAPMCGCPCWHLFHLSVARMPTPKTGFSIAGMGCISIAFAFLIAPWTDWKVNPNTKVRLMQTQH